jgi:hypothetical protein
MSLTQIDRDSQIKPGIAYDWVTNDSTGKMSQTAVSPSSAVATDANGLPIASTTTATELSYVHGVTSSIQTQISGLQPSGNYITALTGDVTATGPGSVAATLATVNSNVGSFGSSTSIPSFTVNAKGLITAASGNAVVAPAGTLSGTTLNSTVVTSSLTSVGTIATGIWNGTTIAIANGGTGHTTAAASFNALSPMTTAGDMIYENNTPSAARLAIGSTGQVLTVSGGLPVWATPATSGTVTSVGLADASTAPIYTITNSPVTSAGTLTFTLNTESANTVFAGPTTGSAAQPTFRSLVVGDLSFAGSANGVATLDAGGKVPVAELPSTVMLFLGSWNPTTNTPTLADGTGTNGDVYWVTAAYAGPIAGLFNASMHNFQVGDLVIYNGSQWELSSPAAGVQSVNGSQGIVTVNAINQLTGDVTTSAATGSQSEATTLATVNSNVGSFTYASITVNGKGLITAASSGTAPTTYTADGTTLTLTGNQFSVTTGGISNTQISGSAAIAFSKLAALPSADILVGSAGNVATAVAMSGDATISNTGVITITGGLTNHFVTREVPTGLINGSNVTFTLANTPVAGTECIFLNGLLQNVGAGNDYTISGATITFVVAPETGSVILVNYQK